MNHARLKLGIFFSGSSLVMASTNVNISGPTNVTVEVGRIAKFVCSVSGCGSHFSMLTGNGRQIIPEDPLSLNMSLFFDDSPEDYGLYNANDSCENDTEFVLTFWFVVTRRSVEVVKDGVYCEYIHPGSQSDPYVQPSRTDSAYLILNSTCLPGCICTTVTEPDGTIDTDYISESSSMYSTSNSCANNNKFSLQQLMFFLSISIYSLLCC